MGEQAKHTPGPWTIAADIYEERFGIGGRDGVVVCAPFLRSGPKVGVHGLANARLIAAAPELLEALSELADLMEDVRTGEYKPDSFTTQPARAAIAKAQGQVVDPDLSDPDRLNADDMAGTIYRGD